VGVETDFEKAEKYYERSQNHRMLGDLNIERWHESQEAGEPNEYLLLSALSHFEEGKEESEDVRDADYCGLLVEHIAEQRRELPLRRKREKIE